MLRSRARRSVLTLWFAAAGCGSGDYAAHIGANSSASGAWVSDACGADDLGRCQLRCSEEKVADACNNVGVILERSDSSGDESGALVAYRHACLMGSIGSCHNEARLRASLSLPQATEVRGPRPDLAGGIRDGDGDSVPNGDDGDRSATLFREAFSRTYSCPLERINITSSPSPSSSPPLDIASDPERLALWRRNHARERLLKADGCGRAAVLRCSTDPNDQMSCAPDVDATNESLLESAKRQNALGHLKLGVVFADPPAGETGTGLRVIDVLPGSPAEGNLQKGDAILQANGKPMLHSTDLAQAVDSGAGMPLELRIRRGNEERTVTVNLGN